VHDLAEVLDVTYVIAGRVIAMADGQEGIRTLAVWGGADYLPNMEYSLLHTPCQDVTDQSMCFHACGIQADYPRDTLLVDMRAESYIGMPMIDTEGRTLGILSAIDTKPISEDKRLLALSLLSIFAARGAAELQHQEREQLLEQKVRQRTEALLAAQATLVEQEKMAALGALVAGVAHEVNTPIGVAVTAASSMSSYAAELVRCVSGERVSRSALIATARQLCDAALLVERNLARAADLIGNFKQLAVDQGSAHVSEIGLREHVVMLSARIEALDGAPSLLLEFADDGVGLAPEVGERLFEPFFTTKRGQGGSGLGMHIVYTIVHQMGGQVALVPSREPAPAGCRIRIRLPARTLA
jgi:two-component system NtrC family sensor kinase